jgi:hypothetical protein
VCASVGNAAYLDLDGSPTTRQRLSALGLTQESIRATAFDVPSLAHGRGESVVATLRWLIDQLSAVDRAPRVLVVDSFGRLMDEAVESCYDADSVTRVLSWFAALAARSCVVLLDHTSRRVNGRPGGSVVKLAFAHTVLTLKPLSVDLSSTPNASTTAEVIITKDRDGGIHRHGAAGSSAGVVLLEGAPGSGVTGVRFVHSRAGGVTA